MNENKIMDEYKKPDNSEQIEYPKIIKVKKSDIKSDVEMDVSEFLDLIKNDKIDVIFRDKYRFFIVKEGCRFSTNHFGFFNFEEYFEVIDNSEDYSLFIKSEFYYNFEDYSSFIKSEKTYFKKEDEIILQLAKLSFFKNGLSLSDYEYREYIQQNMNFGDIDNENLMKLDRENLMKLRQKYIVRNYKEYIKAKKLGFHEKVEYADAMKLGIANYDDYHSYEAFYSNEEKIQYNNEKYYKKYLKAEKLGFQNKKENEYDEAIELGIDNYEDYSSFKKSGFYKFEEYLKANKLGFESSEDYEYAMDLGFNNCAEYKEFQESGCKSKEEFEFFKKMPQIIKNMNKKINKIVKDADNAFKSNQFEEFIRLKFLSIEKIADITHLKVFKQEKWEGEDLKVDNIINEIERELNLELTDHEELKYWRRIRNKIIHEHLKIERDKAEKGKEFFDELYNNLKKYS